MARKKKGLIEAPAPIEGLPDCDGKPVVGVVSKFSGTSQRIQRAIEMDERGFALVEWKSDDWGHKRSKDGIKRHQTLAVLDLYELDDDDVDGLVQKYRSRYHADDPQLSIDEVDQAELAAALAIDQSGVALTPTEAAEANGTAAPTLPPFFGFLDLTAEQIIERIGTCTDADLELVDAIDAWEESHEQRDDVLAAIKEWRG